MRKMFIPLLFAVSTTVWADDVTDAISKATELYNEGKTQQAVSQLEFAAQLIRQQRGSDMQSVLPKALDGWTADEAESASAGTAMFGGGTTISRKYHKDGKTLTVNIITDSPMVQGMMAMIASPMMAASQGGKIQMIDGNQAVINKDGLMMSVDNTFLIQVEADKGIPEDDLKAYATAVDFEKLKTFK